MKNNYKENNTNYKQMFFKLIDLFLINIIKESELYIKHAQLKLDLLEKRKANLLKTEPILFKKSWNNEIDQINEEIFMIYQEIGKEINNMSDISKEI